MSRLHVLRETNHTLLAARPRAEAALCWPAIHCASTDDQPRRAAADWLRLFTPTSSSSHTRSRTRQAQITTKHAFAYCLLVSSVLYRSHENNDALLTKLLWPRRNTRATATFATAASTGEHHRPATRAMELLQASSPSPEPLDTSPSATSSEQTIGKCSMDTKGGCKARKLQKDTCLQWRIVGI